MKIITKICFASALALAPALTSTAAVPCVPRGTAAALYVNCGPISRNPDAQRMWKNLQQESHALKELADGIAELAKDEDFKEMADTPAWENARFDWAVVTLADYKFRMTSAGKLRLPQITCTLGGLFEAEPFSKALIASDLKNGSASEITGLGFKAYSFKDKDGDLDGVANVNPCLAVPQDGLMMIASNKTALKQLNGLYAGTVQPEKSVSKVFAKSPNGLLALYLDLTTLDKNTVKNLFSMADMPAVSIDGIDPMFDNCEQLRIFVSVENARELRISYEYIVKQTAPNWGDATDKDIVPFMKKFLENILAEMGHDDIKLKDFSVTQVGRTLRIQAVVNAAALCKILDEPDDADEDADEDDDED